MISFDGTYLLMNIAIIDMLNKIKGYVNNVHQYTRKMAITHDKFLDLLNLRFIKNRMDLQWKQQHFQTQKKFICSLKNKLQYPGH